jgi:hypothetical protein
MYVQLTNPDIFTLSYKPSSSCVFTSRVAIVFIFHRKHIILFDFHLFMFPFTIDASGIPSNPT